MTIKEAMSRIDKLAIPRSDGAVYKSVIEIIARHMQNDFKVIKNPTREDVFLIAVCDDVKEQPDIKKPAEGEWGYLQLNEQGRGKLVVSRPHLLYSLCSYILVYLGEEDIATCKKGRLFKIGFKWNRPVFDCCLTQFFRTVRHFDFKTHIREYARMGCSHIEVNALATPHGLEQGVPHEVYPVFYTYCAALDQFVSSRLNDGIYPREYLTANLTRLKKYAAEAIKYGMKPGLHCFEPRNVPDTLLQKYPMLRGARVDHPLRSLKPRYNLALAHPFVRMHYKELIRNLLKAVPEIDYISIVTNDSGAGFEFTRSLYVGANGGPYLIREWNSVSDVARAAAKNAMSFFKLLRDAGREINPDFRVMFRLLSFADEQDYLLEELDDHIDIEGPTFKGRGYAPVYTHPRYKDIKGVDMSVWQNRFDEDEQDFMQFMKKQNGRAHVLYSFGGYTNLDNLLGIPFPWLLYEKLDAMYKVKSEFVAFNGGIHPPSLVPWCINRQVVRAFQHDPDIKINDFVKRVATLWVDDLADDLIKVWKQIDKAIRTYPVPGLYSNVGNTWYRLWSRPIVPDIEAISETERQYYERFMLAPPHNPNRVDLNQDVLFELSGPDKAAKMMKRMDENTIPMLHKALAMLYDLKQKSNDKSGNVFFVDLYDRIRALKCWITTQRNVQAWVAGVHGYLRSNDKAFKKECRTLLKKMVQLEIENMKELLDLWQHSSTDFVVISGQGESVHALGENFGEHIERKIELMRQHGDDEPHVDPKFIWRVPDLDFYSQDDMEPGATPMTGKL
ncbi:hypothetical protein GF407_11035 [candidate division KSB1 bacterium]|nr:hypothetical protein [candidate division KSB1 bacterium]